MVHIKQEEEAKRKKLQEQIAAQKEQIQAKELLIGEKRRKLETMETEYDDKLKELQAQYKAELERKNDLNKELQAVK
jgi:phage host-nuclease inhibitor protein Gam